MKSFPPIEDHGVIGDLHTVALVAKDGTIDWYCHPHIDSPSLFAALLDLEKGGYWSLRLLDGNVTNRQMYLPETNVLVTRYLSDQGIAEVCDYMPIERVPEEHHHHRLVRRISAIRGAARFRMECRPAFDYARARHEVSVVRGGFRFDCGGRALGLLGPVPLERDGDGVTAEFDLAEGETVSFVLQAAHAGEVAGPMWTETHADLAFMSTVDYWRRWVKQCTYKGRWRGIVHRSALALKLLTFEPTGAIVAAATTSLPEAIGAARNWDYRYTWIRDAAFTLHAFMAIGFHDEAEAFIEWLLERSAEIPEEGGVQVMYAVDGRKDLVEETLDHLSGYLDSRPVRIGNAAYKQQQLDIYGAILDAIYLADKYSRPISWQLWQNIRQLIAWLQKNWHRPDHGMWEVRGGRYQFVNSKVMAWVAFNRALRIARFRGLPAPLDEWERTQNEIYEWVMRHGWDDELGSFVQYEGSQCVDAANLIMPLVKFISPNDPRMLSTIRQTRERLAWDALVHRYDPAHAADDGIDGSKEGSFTLCSFWLVECLARSGQLDEARILFEKILMYGNHLGLYAEEIGTHGEALGNFPQAFTHLALISAAVTLDRLLG